MPNTRFGSFAAEVEQWVRETEGVMTNVIKASAVDAVTMAQRTKNEGGKMPVDTGFLRSSGRAALDGWPQGPSEKPSDAKPGSYAWDGKQVTTTIAALEPGDTFYFGWTAVYALRQEVYNGFMGATQQQWQAIVTRNVERLKR